MSNKRPKRAAGSAAPLAVADQPFYASIDSEMHLTDTMPAGSLPAQHVVRLIKDQHELDFKERLNTSSYVNVVFEDEEREVAQLGLGVNIADQTVYPQSFELHNCAVNMIADLWHCPKPDDFDEYGCFAGAGTVGSTEACLLAGLALKFRWRKWYAAKTGKSAAEVRGITPNLVISTMYQAAWEKLFKYMDILPRHVMPKLEGPEKDGWAMDPAEVAAVVDDETIGVVCIMGNHYSGHYDPVADVATAVRAANAAKGLQLGLHIDGASGGFVAPFQSGLPPWDFRVPEVLSISASGHKFGQSCCGTGWVVWRERKNLSEHVAISVSYLGGRADSYTLNFSRPASGIYVQLYKFLRLGRAGYTQVVNNMMSVSKYLRSGLSQMVRDDGVPWFRMLDFGDERCLPVVTAMLNPELGAPFDSIDLQHALSMDHWYVSGYKMSFHDPTTEETISLFRNGDADMTIFRVVVKANLTMSLADNLLKCFKVAIAYLAAHGEGFSKKHPKQIKHAGHAPC